MTLKNKNKAKSQRTRKCGDLRVRVVRLVNYNDKETRRNTF